MEMKKVSGLMIRLVKTFAPVTALSPSAVFASMIENAPATKIVLTAQSVAAKHIVDETLCFSNCHLSEHYILRQGLNS